MRNIPVMCNIPVIVSPPLVIASVSEAIQQRSPMQGHLLDCFANARNDGGHQKTLQGFTLLEILIALAIFATLALLTTTALQQAMRSKNILYAQTQALRKLELSLALLSADTTQITARSVTGDEMRQFPPFIGQPSYVEFTRGGEVQLMRRQSTLIRVAYLCENHQLIRRRFPILDTNNRQRYTDKVLFDKLSTCRFAYLNSARQTLPIWRENAVRENQQAEPLPKAVQLILTHPLWGEMSNLFTIPEALYADIESTQQG